MINQKTINNLIKKNKEYFDAFENYDKTGEWLISRKRIDITLDKRIIKRLYLIKSKTKKPISRIIEECIKNELNKLASP